MTSDRANPFGGLDSFQAHPKPAPKPFVREHIEQLAEESGFTSRQPAPPRSAAQSDPKALPRRQVRRYTTGRNQQINIKARAETIDRLYRIADRMHVPLGEVLELALASLERHQHNKGSRPE